MTVSKPLSDYTKEERQSMGLKVFAYFFMLPLLLYLFVLIPLNNPPRAKLAKLHVGMLAGEVTDILGEPDMIENGDEFSTWTWGLSTELKFHHGYLRGGNTPAFYPPIATD